MHLGRGMKGKILKVVGIVLLSILAFVGVVVGVMAIQGKFKRPIVYPSELVFETNNFVVVNDDTVDDVHLHSFILTGKNGNKTVNRKTCYLKFVDRIGSEYVYGEELITLCHSDKTPIEKETEGNFVGYYKVNCNEPIYYTFKAMGSDPAHYKRINYGKVVLEAYAEKDIGKSNQLVFYVDKAVEQIRLSEIDNYTTEIDTYTHKQHGTQVKTLTLGSRVEFDYEILPYYSALPYSDRQDGKNIELYYDDELESGDYLPVEINSFNQNEKLSEFITEEDGKLYFEPKKPGGYSFIYAIFNSYTAQENSTQTNFIKDRVREQMVYTILNIDVTSEKAESVSIDDDLRLNLKLYNNTELALNDSQTNQNLGLMLNGGTESDLFDVLEFKLNQNRFWSNTVTFVAENDLPPVKLTNGENVNYRISNGRLNYNNNTYSITIHPSKISINGAQLIESISLEGNEYYCQNGVAFLGENEITMLRSGGYLDFFTYDETNNSYTKSNLEYNVTKLEGTGAKAKYNLLLTSAPELNVNTSLRLMVLMVGSDGKVGGEGKLFDSANVLISTEQFVPNSQNLNQLVDLQISYNQDAVNYGFEAFENVVNLTGTYAAGVLVTQYNDSGYSIEVIPNITYTLGGIRYVLVGTNENGQFNNIIKAKDRADSSSTTIYLMVLKNAYNQTTEQYVNAKIETSANFTQTEVVSLYLDSPITVENNYQLVDNLTYDFNESAEYESNTEDKDNYIIKTGLNYHVLEFTKNHVVKISSPYQNMLFNIYNKISKNSFACFINGEQCLDAITIVSLGLSEDNNSLIITFNSNNYDLLNGESFTIGLSYNGNVYNSPAIVVDSAAPSQITFDYEENVVNLPNSYSSSWQTDSEDILPTINVKIVGIDDGGDYLFRYSYNGHEIADLATIFNDTYIKGSQVNFKPAPAYSNELVSYAFSYTTLGDSVLKINKTDLGYNVQVLKIGKSLLAVSLKSNIDLGDDASGELDEIVGYIRLDVTTENGFSFALKDGKSQITSTGNDNELSEIILTNYVIYSYNTKQYTDAKYFNISNVASYNKTYKVNENDNGFEIVDEFDVVVVTISKENTIWRITKSQVYAYANVQLSFDVSVITSSEPLSLEIYFSNSITVDLNAAYNAEIYEGTNVLLLETKKGNANEVPFEKNSIFRIRELVATSNTYFITYKVFGTDEEKLINQEEYIKIDNAGNYTFTIYSSADQSFGNDKRLATYNLRVLPNVVFSADNTQRSFAEHLESDSEVDLSKIVTVKQFNTTVNYGDTSGDIYANNNLIDLQNVAELEFKNNNYNDAEIFTFKNKDDISTLTELKLQTLWLINLDDQVQQPVSICYKTTSFDIDVLITNKYAKLIEYKAEPYKVSARVKLDAPISFNVEGQNWHLESVIANGYTFSVLNNQFMLDQDIGGEIENVALTFNFAFDGEDAQLASKKLSYTNANNNNGNVRNISIVLTPNLPPIKENVNAISNNEFDIITDVFNLESAQEGIASITIEKEKNAELYNLISQTEEISYTFAENLNNTKVNFKDINGNDIKINVVYHVVYGTGEVSYDFNYQLTILNRQELKLVYPYKDYGGNIAASSFRVLNNDSDTINYLQHLSEIDSYEYEIVNVGQTISFGNSNRAQVLDRADDSAELANQIKAVEWVAYTGNPNQNLVSIATTEQNMFLVSFNERATAYILLKITTKSGNFDFYLVHLYNQMLKNDYKDINSTNTWEFNVNTDNLKFYSTNKILGQTFDRALLLDKFKLQNGNPTNNNFRLYLLEANLLGNEDANAYYNLTNIEQFSLVNEKSLNLLTQFATLKIALIYIGTTDSAELYLGNIIVYAHSKNSVEVNNENVKDLKPEMSNGEYKITWSSDLGKIFSNPFVVDDAATPNLTIDSVSEGFGFTDSSVYLSSTDNTVFAISSSDVAQEKYLTIPLSFVVKYAYTIADETLYLYVHFEIPPVNPPTERLNRTITFDKANEQFIDELKISLYDYKGNISLNVNGEKISATELHSKFDNVTSSYVDGELDLNFTLQPEAYRVEFKIVYDDLANADLSFDVAILVDSAVGTNILEDSNENSTPIRLNATKTTEDDSIYKNITASKLDITKTDNTYQIGGLRISTFDNAKLELLIKSNEKFVTSNLTENVLTISESGSIDFAHNANDNDIVVEIAIQIKTDSGAIYKNFNGDDIVKTLYVTVPKTYSGLVARYMAVGTNHENVSSGSTINTIRANLFGKNENGQDKFDSKIYNTNKIAILNLKNEIVFADWETGFATMGFINKANANYVSINIDGTMVNQLTPNAEDDNLSFQKVSETRTTNIVLTNIAGVNNFSYSYQVLKDFDTGANSYSIVDGILADDNYLSQTTVDENNIQTVDFSFVMNKDGNNIPKFETEELTIGKMFDAINEGVYIKDISASTSFLRNESTADGRNRYILKFGVGSPKYSLILSSAADHSVKIQLKYESTETNTDEKLNFALTLVGNGGEFKVSFNFYNCTITDIAEQNITEGSGELTIDLANQIETIKEDSALDISFEYDRNGSYCNYRNVKYLNLATDSNGFFTLTQEGKTNIKIQIKLLSSDAEIFLVYKVKEGDKLIGYLNVRIVAECKLEFKINDSQVVNGLSAKQTDNYNIWLDNPTSGGTTFKRISLFNYNSNNTSVTTKQFENLVYNDSINLSLFNSGTGKRIDSDSVDISIVDDNGKPIASNYYQIEEEDGVIYLKFVKDFSGDIILKLTGTTSRDDFVRYITLHVLGYIKLSLTSDLIYTSGSSSAFNSGSTVNLINSYSGAIGLALYTYATAENAYEGVTTTVKQAIAKELGSDKNLASIFEEMENQGNTTTPEVSKTTSTQGFGLTTKLPIVPMTGDNYFVIYRVSLKYLEHETDNYYFAYVVRNDIAISANTNTINADTDLVGNNKLSVFRYYMTYTVANTGKNYIVYYGKDGLKLYDVNATTEYSGTSEGNVLTFSHSGSTIKISPASADRATVTADDQQNPATRSIQFGSVQDGNFVLYSLSYKNIIDFKALIDDTYVRIDAGDNSGLIDSVQKTLYYKLDYISTNSNNDYGTYGIDLTKPYKSNSFASGEQLTITKLFNNELIATINLVSKVSNDTILSTSINLNSANSLNPKGLTLNEIFGLNRADNLNYTIIGVGNSASSSWVNSASGVSNDQNTNDTVEYNGTTYQIYKATWYNSSNSSKIYNLSKECYYIHTTSLILVNYTSGESNSFIVKKNDFDSSQFNASNKLVQYVNESGELKRKSLSPITITEVSSDFQEGLTNTDTTITITWDALVKYKNQNPNKELIVKCKLSYSSTSWDITINFKLPDNELISVSNLVVDLNKETKDLEITNTSNNYNITIPSDEDGQTYVPLDSNNATGVTLSESGTNFSSISISTVENSTNIIISLKVDEIKNYFNSNNEETLLINFVLSINSQQINIDVLIKNPNL